MKKIDFPLIADTLFYALCTFVFSLCLLRYFRVGVGLSFALSVLFSLAVAGLCVLLLYDRHHKKFLSKQQKEERDKLLLHLALEKPERVRAALLTAFTADGKEAHCQGDELQVEGLLTVPLFAMQPVSADEIAHLIRRNGTELSVICNALSPEAERLLSSFGIAATRGEEVCALFERTNTVPAPLICGNLPRRTVKAKLRRSFSKKNARPFLASGLLLLVMSLFTLFPVYYLITGSILLLAAVTVRLFGYA